MGNVFADRGYISQKLAVQFRPAVESARHPTGDQTTAQSEESIDDTHRQVAVTEACHHWLDVALPAA